MFVKQEFDLKVDENQFFKYHSNSKKCIRSNVFDKSSKNDFKVFKCGAIHLTSILNKNCSYI